MKKIKSALISVFYKDGLDEIINILAENDVTIYSTGGTLDFIEKIGHKAVAVEDLTSYPSILGGRVKTLHPKVFGGILARRDNEKDQEQLAQYEIPEIDLVIVDLYPFEETVASGADHAAVIEKIDIGGISLIRGAAKNYNDVVIVSSREQYGELVDLLRTQNCSTSIVNRLSFAAKAFGVSSHYDSQIFNYFNRTEALPSFRCSFDHGKELRYGENPHQKAMFFGDLDKLFTKLNGKDISYNNMLDVEAGINLISEFSEPTFVVMKHNNACGVASRSSIAQAWTDALAGDPVSAFGGVLIANREIDVTTAEEISKLFFEVILAPGYTDEALAVLMSKKNRIILNLNPITLSDKQFRSILGGVVVQDRDMKVGGVDTELVTATKRPIEQKKVADLLFANKIVKHSKSNAIVIAKDGMLLASGIGQTSRVDALRQAIAKADSFGHSMTGAVLASDAFFPFADCVEIAAEVGIDTFIQPGGSIRDNDSVEYCDNHNLSMGFTTLRHFKH